MEETLEERVKFLESTRSLLVDEYAELRGALYKACNIEDDKKRWEIIYQAVKPFKNLKHIKIKKSLRK